MASKITQFPRHLKRTQVAQAAKMACHEASGPRGQWEVARLLEALDTARSVQFNTQTSKEK